MHSLKRAGKFLNYRLRAKSRHGVHSPFVYELIDSVIPEEGTFYSWEKIEALRSKLLSSDEVITVKDFGAGSKVFATNERPVKGIAKHVLQPADRGQVLFRLVNHFKPESILELGTSLGITTLYLAAPNPNAQVTTLEGCPNILAVAKKQFEQFGATNIATLEGKFSDNLPTVLAALQQLDFAFIDGHHAKEPTLNYFHQCLAKTHNDSVLVFDDIHWSDEMEEAWEEIKSHPEVTVTIDMFYFGLVFFRKEQEPEHFTLRY